MRYFILTGTNAHNSKITKDTTWFDKEGHSVIKAQSDSIWSTEP